jgi:hypothetical protein
VDEHANPARLEGSRDTALSSGSASSDSSATHLDSTPSVPVWCPVANMTSERPYGPGGGTTKRGSKHFAPGAKLYFRRVMGYTGDPQLEVIGRHRGSHRYVTMVVSLSWLESWRKDLVYSPYVARALQPYWTGTPGSEFEAAFYVQKFLSKEP